MASSSFKQITVELVYAYPDEQHVARVTVPEGMSVKAAIELSGILHQFPEIDLAKNKVGIFSKRVDQNKLLSQGDRIEIYRALSSDPKDRRKTRLLGIKKGQSA